MELSARAQDFAAKSDQAFKGIITTFHSYQITELTLWQEIATELDDRIAKSPDTSELECISSIP